jgi:hypothetical protein
MGTTPVTWDFSGVAAQCCVPSRDVDGHSWNADWRPLERLRSRVRARHSSSAAATAAYSTCSWRAVAAGWQRRDERGIQRRLGARGRAGGTDAVRGHAARVPRLPPVRRAAPQGRAELCEEQARTLTPPLGRGASAALPGCRHLLHRWPGSDGHLLVALPAPCPGKTERRISRQISSRKAIPSPGRHRRTVSLGGRPGTPTAAPTNRRY